MRLWGRPGADRPARAPAPVAGGAPGGAGVPGRHGPAAAGGLTFTGLVVELNGQRVLHGIDATFPPGRLTVLIGANGAGKSTLLRAAAGLLPLAAGEARLGGVGVVARLPPAVRARQLAWVPDHSDVPFAFTVLETVVLGRYPWHGGAPRGGDLARARTALAQVGIAALSDRRLAALSSGERQKALVARALAGDAPCLLLDEPCANLDIGAALRLMQLLQTLAAQGLTVCATLHDIGLAHRFADHAVCLAAGTVAATGAARDVFTPAVLDPVFGVRTTVAAGVDGRPATLQFDAH